VKKYRYIIAVLVIAVILQIPVAAAPSFTDVKSGQWYDDYLDYIEMLEGMEIINGYGDGTFRPGNTLKRSEFLKMLAISSELYTITPSKGVHWAEQYWNMLNEAGVLENTDIQCTFNSLEKPITRYEMAMLVNNTLYNVFCENTMEVTSASTNISDYGTMDMKYRSSVEQVYGKGIITGYEDSSFRGAETLTRVQSVAVIVRLLWGGERKDVSFAKEKDTPQTDPNFTSFAMKYRTMTVEQRRIELFGNANKTYFTSASDAANYMTTVTVPIWKLNSSGQKYAASATLTVHKLVAEEVKLIFQEIYDDPERFPINSIGGARYSDTLRHSWGCAIDINPNENYYVNYSTGSTVGSYCYKNGTSPYCITPNGSVVRAFAKYGWGWGGQGWSSGVDYMHFSILSSGG
jgi:hypothetical protein